MDTATVKPVATKEVSRDVDLSESVTESEEEMTGRPVARKTATGNQNAREVHVSPATVHHTEAVFSIVRRIYGREHDDPMDDLDVTMAIEGMFLNTSLRAAVRLGQDHEANLRYVQNHFWVSVGLLLNENEKLIGEQKEITVVSTIIFKDCEWTSTSLWCSKAYQITNAKAHVFSDSVLCGGKMGDDPIATWKSKIGRFSENADGVRVENIPRKSNERPIV